MNLYTIYDKVAEEAGPIFEAKNDGVATRAYQDLFSSRPVAHPDEFKLMLLGAIDKTTGKILTLDIPKEIYVAPEVKNG